MLTEKILFQKSSLVFSLPLATPPPGLVKDLTFPEIFLNPSLIIILLFWMLSRPGPQSSTSRPLTWIQRKLGKHHFKSKRFYHQSCVEASFPFLSLCSSHWLCSSKRIMNESESSLCFALIITYFI